MEAEIKRLLQRALSGRIPKPQRLDEGTLVYPFDPEWAWVLMHYARTPSRILWDLVSTEAERLEPLYDDVRAWVESHLPDALAHPLKLSVRVRSVGDFPAGPLQVRGTVKNGLLDGAKARKLDWRLAPYDPDVEFVVSGETAPRRIAIDLGGKSMHLRGYRKEGGKAPIKETLAAQMLILARWDARQEALLDPMAGSGTLPIEAALSATGAPLWTERPDLSLYRLALFAGREPPSEALYADTRPAVFAHERHPPLLTKILANAARAGVEDSLVVLHGDYRTLTPERLRIAYEDRHGETHSLERGLILMNPPYGTRLGEDEDLEALYGELADWCRTWPDGWRVALISPHPAVEMTFGRQPKLKKPMSNGPLRGYFYVYDAAALKT